MENRHWLFLLAATTTRRFFLLWAMVCLPAAVPVMAAEKDSGYQEPIIQPEISRREIVEPDIDTEDFEFGAFVGLMSIEDFGSHLVYGGRAAYHVTEDFFVEAAVGFSKAGTTSFEDLSGSAQLLTGSERDFTYYNLSAGWNILPGEVFLGRGRAFNNQLYVIAGAGSTRFAGDDRFTINVGVGNRFLISDAFAVHLDLRDHIFDIDLLGREKTTHNIEFHGGLTFFF